MERKKYLRSKARDKLSLAELFEVATVSPSDLDGFHFESKVRQVMQELVEFTVHLNKKNAERIDKMEINFEA